MQQRVTRTENATGERETTRKLGGVNGEKQWTVRMDEQYDVLLRMNTNNWTFTANAL